MAIGAPYNSGNGQASGHVRVYKWNGVDWLQKGTDFDSEAQGDFAYITSLSSNGNIIAIGATSNHGSAFDSGHVRIYEWDGISWMQKGLDIDGESHMDLSGEAIELSSDGNIIIIGATRNDASATNSGHARVFQWNGLSWVQKGLDIDGESWEDYSGSSVSIDSIGNTIAVGAYRNDDNGGNSGHVKIYYWSGVNWIQKGLNVNGESTDDWSGYSVNLSSDGNTLVIGAHRNDDNGSNSGHTRIYDWDGASWIQKGLDIDGKSTNYASGFSVNLNSDGNTVVIGSPGKSSGLVRVYNYGPCPSYVFNDTIIACDSIKWIDDITYTSSNSSASWILPGTNGCDTTVNLDLTINYSNTSIDVITVCDSITWIDGLTYTSSNNMASWIMQNSNGCDSIVNLDLSINHSSSTIDVVVACDSLTWIDGATYTSSNNNATWFTQNTSGCDSVVHLDLTINFSSLVLDSIVACDSLTWIDGITYYSSNQTASFVSTNSAGCDSIISLNLILNETPSFPSVNDTIVCLNDGLPTLSSYSLGNGIINWYSDSALQNIIFTGNNFTPSINGHGLYTYYVRESNNGCSGPSNPILLQVNDPKSIINANPISGISPVDVSFGNGSLNASWYAWNFGTGDTSNLFEPSYIYENEGQYIVELKVSDSFGCMDKTQITIEVNVEYSVSIPNTITPNGDDFNDFWIIDNIEQFPEHIIQVFNRNGSLVFETTNYQNDWSGQYNGSDLPATTYYYIIDLGSGEEILKGDLSIIRE